MSSPPEYQSLLQRDPGEHVDGKQQHHAYPPVPATAGEGSGAGAPAVVTYTFEPRWPMKGKPEDALGVLYPNLEATVQAVQRIFPLLDEYSPDQVEILAPVHVDVGPSRWGVIQEDAWRHITNAGSAPKQLKVQIKDLPGQGEKRRQRQRFRTTLLVTSVLASPFLFFGTIAGVAWLFGGFDD